MNGSRWSGLVLSASLLVAAPAGAGELAGVSLPDSVTVGGKTLVLNGIGLREKIGFDVYVAGLYLEKKSGDAAAILGSNQARQLRMHFVYKKVTAQKLVDGWVEGFEANAGAAAERQRANLDRLNSWMEDVVRGDEIVFGFTPESGLGVVVRGTSKGVIADPEFARAFWSIFLGAKPPTAALKRGLLGQG